MKKTVFITGAATGIGNATIKLFATEGWNVITAIENAEQEAEFDQSENIMVLSLNAMDSSTIRQGILSGIQRFKQIDVVINNAGFGSYGIFESLAPEEIRRQFDKGVFGVMNIIRAILPHFKKVGKGVIINLSSPGGRIAVPQASLYTASKFAMEGFSESLSYELATQNIILKLVECGNVDFDLIQKAANIFARNYALTPYEDYLQKIEKVADFLVEGVVSMDKIAKVIFEAATDGSNKLRYQCGNDSKSWVEAKAKLTDSDYMNYMYNLFGFETKPEIFLSAKY